ncbi:hypothetical protein S7711_00360 [Stachybotrys chartarum IBT 7711]|uniref:OBG-type G domain-containing protein n=1 Tax=Stachybotrys chartarum (strain CBS 109288 / IBT 7711) TaxID=1280523 RepID=A0A084B9H4_STACB|nr:hypothetical protein S7711_00360 [Stachybotrys chartarum IBT 7711]
MAPRYPSTSSILTPFLYPSFFFTSTPRVTCAVLNGSLSKRSSSTSTSSSRSTVNDLPESRLNPKPDDYAAPNFADKAQLTLYAGRGGSGCISFLREAFLPDGPPNGGDGGAGGSIFIQAAHGETSLHKLARRRFVRAGRGKTGQGSSRSGTRGEDVVITVPVGTIVREVERTDPVADEELTFRAWRALQKQRKREERERLEQKEETRRLLVEDNGWDPDTVVEVEDSDGSKRSRNVAEEEEEDLELDDPRRDKWLLYPGMSKTEMRSSNFPPLPTRTRYLQQPPAPVYLDLSKPSPRPILLAAGGVGGLGNPHFTSRAHPRPIFATKGDEAVTMTIQLELKLLADVGLVGLPNAGKSTLLRAISNSRTRVGNWAFTTLQPNIGTVVLDKYSGRPDLRRSHPRSSDDPDADAQGDSRTRFTVADIPGLIEGAHLDRGLGIAFLRHVERARVLAFVIDLAAGNAVKALQSLWHEVGLYAQMRDEEEQDRELGSRVDWNLDTESDGQGSLDATWAEPAVEGGKSQSGLRIAAKPWYVVATKADLPETQANFLELKKYLSAITKGETPHPSGVDGAWVRDCAAIPVSAINGQGVDRIIHWTVGLLDEDVLDQ